MAYTIGLLRAAHRGASVALEARFRVPGGPAGTGWVVGIGSKVSIQAEGIGLVENIRPEWIEWADVAE
ncbi:hypothetical protein ACFZCK_14105 [Kitasatospora purpeofusca]|uniref:hypothetical protein n=1 Tax=Kitasatospora purpeofusca TaxID=67352 RepID=UPI0036EF3EEC